VVVDERGRLEKGSAGRVGEPTDPLGTDPIDRGFFARFTRGDVALEQEVFALFCAQMPVNLQRLRAASGRQWRDAAHTIKGSAAAIGAFRLAAAAERAEMIDSANPAAREDAINSVGTAADDVCRHIQALQAR
jgi:HPt (histidine-containing phosphotransfer) domain-containing protein